MLLIGIGLWSLIRTGLGTALSAIGVDEEAVKSSGLNTNRIKLFIFTISAMVAGIGGALYVHYLGSIAPRALFDINFLFSILVAALVGGAGTIVGPIIGAYFLTFLLEYLRPYIPGAGRFVLYGVITLVVYYFAPKGLYSIFSSLRQRLSGKAGTG
jgi:branched-chain amino acid transport system permease protein